MKNYAAAPGGRVSKYGMTVSLLATQIEAIDKLTLERAEGRSAVVRMLIAEALAARGGKVEEEPKAVMEAMAAVLRTHVHPDKFRAACAALNAALSGETDGDA